MSEVDTAGSQAWTQSDATISKSKNQSAIASSSDVKAYTDDHHIDKRTILYPKLSFLIGLELARTFSAYIQVKTSILGKIFPIGQTETMNCSIDEFNNEVLYFNKFFDVAYQIGVDERQWMIFEVMDGDNFQTGDGYLFCSIKVPIATLLKPKSRIPISRGTDVLGYLIVSAAVDLDPQTASIQTDRTQPVDVSSIAPLNVADFFETAVMGYFPYRPPTEDEVRKKHQEIPEVMTSYVFSFATKGICPKTPDEMGTEGRAFIKLCVNVEQKEHPRHMRKAKTQHHTHDNLHAVWKSNKMDKPPYDFNVPEIRLSREELTGSRKTDAPIRKSIELVFQVYLEGLIGPDGTGNPFLVSYCKFKLGDVLASGHTNKDGDAISTHSFVKVLPLSSQHHEEEVTGNPEELKQSFFARLSSKFKKLTAEEDSDVGSLADEIEEAARGGRKVLDEDEEDVDGMEVDGVETKFIETGEPLGKITLIMRPAYTQEVNLTSGELYEEDLRKLYAQELVNWKKRMHSPFHHASDEQSSRTLRTINLCELMMKGWAIRPTLIVDLNTPCTQHIVYKRLLKKSTEPSFLGSRCIDAMKVLYETILPFAKNGEFRAFAGGGVYAPPGTTETGMGSHVQKDPGHWQYGHVRQSAFPLAHELLLANGGSGVPEGEEEPPSLKWLVQALDERDGGGVDDWGGRSYCKAQRYRSIVDLMGGAMEAATTYTPCLCPDEDDGDEPEEDLEEAPENIQKTRIMSSFVGTAPMECGSEFWELIPPGLQSPVSYNADPDAIDFLLSEPSEGYLEAKVVVVVIGKPPSVEYLEKYKRVLEKHVADKNPKAALLIVLAAERRQEMDYDNQQIVAVAAEPFEAFLEMYKGVVGEKEFVNPQSTKLRLFHFVTWAEVIASCFIDEDKTGKQTMLKVELPEKATIFKIMVHMFHMRVASVSRILGLKELSEKEEKKLERDLKIDGGEEKPEEDSKKRSKSFSLGLGKSLKSFASAFTKKEDTKASLQLSEDEAILQARVEGFQEATELKALFDHEQMVTLQMELRAFMSSYLSALAAKQPSRLGVMATQAVSEVGCESCIMS